MKHITITEMTLENFKGIKDLEISFNKGTHDIYGDNASGKTTIFDAFCWCLFGKNSAGESDSKFGIKTWDARNQVIHHLDHSVELTLAITGENISTHDYNVTLKRLYKEKWVKKRGREEQEFDGHVTLYYWNDNPVKKKEYEQKIGQIINEELFKLITDPGAFIGMHWEKQRKLLIDIVGGEVSDDRVYKKVPEARDINESSGPGMSLEETARSMAAKRRALNEEIKGIAPRIDEVYKSMPTQEDWTALKDEKAKIDSDIEKTETSRRSLLDQASGDMEKITALNKQYREKEGRLYDREDDLLTKFSRVKDIHNSAYKEAQAKYDAADNSMRIAVRKRDDLKADIASAKTRLQSKLKGKDALSEKWDAVSQESFDSTVLEVCPTCKRPMDPEVVSQEKDKLKANFIQDKKRRLDAISTEGVALKQECDDLEAKLNQMEPELEKNDQVIKSLADELSKANQELAAARQKYEAYNPSEERDKAKETDEEFLRIKGEMEKIYAATYNPNEPDTTEQDQAISKLKSRRSEIVVALAKKDTIDKSQARISELEAKEKKLTQQVLDIDRKQSTIDKFIIAKTELTENFVNQMFTRVNFKMFETQINGGVVPTCKATLKGVDIGDVNNAGRIQAGIDIINSLCAHFKVTAPIFIDNAESITSIPYTESQQIRLIVSEKHPELQF